MDCEIKGDQNMKAQADERHNCSSDVEQTTFYVIPDCNNMRMRVSDVFLHHRVADALR
jgi:hypothetical protein